MMNRVVDAAQQIPHRRQLANTPEVHSLHELIVGQFLNPRDIRMEILGIPSRHIGRVANRIRPRSIEIELSVGNRLEKSVFSSRDVPCQFECRP